MLPHWWGMGGEVKWLKLYCQSDFSLFMFIVMVLWCSSLLAEKFLLQWIVDNAKTPNCLKCQI